MVKGTCSVEGCPRTHHARGYCEMHYRRATRYNRLGGPEPEREARRLAEVAPIEQLLSRIEIAANGCWLWTGGGLTLGYGEIQVDGRTVMVHRFAYEFWKEPIPEGLVIDHVCHNADISCPGGYCIHRRCVNPDHLEAVTTYENLRRGQVRARERRRAR